MTYQDKDLSCKECGAEFAFTSSEQAFYDEKGFQNEPSRCPACRAARKAQNNNNRRGGNTGVNNAKCSILLAVHVVLKLKFLSNQQLVNQFTVAIVSKQTKATNF